MHHRDLDSHVYGGGFKPCTEGRAKNGTTIGIPEILSLAPNHRKNFNFTDNQNMGHPTSMIPKVTQTTPHVRRCSCMGKGDDDLHAWTTRHVATSGTIVIGIPKTPSVAANQKKIDAAMI